MAAAIKLTRFDDRLTRLFGSVDAFRGREDDPATDAAIRNLIEAHRELASIEKGCGFYRGQLHRITDGRRRVDDPLLAELDGALSKLEEYVAYRDRLERDLDKLLAPLEADPPKPSAITARQAAATLSSPAAPAPEDSTSLDSARVTPAHAQLPVPPTATSPGTRR
ncbi:hypothetical protein P3T36_003339 [Kitasatospora sp. MAP12-15]|uniref:hypothetical protein n=1 Tax=unclassified Kitasatospora TaxID=2633591 RepID=UPI0024736352|nr:hypothetical protein [Kitasatospora sp. MAP12-44]MDH6111315.1 hypothetical protein [Kitasatospora sp. MAP12-44]